MLKQGRAGGANTPQCDSSVLEHVLCQFFGGISKSQSAGLSSCNLFAVTARDYVKLGAVFPPCIAVLRCADGLCLHGTSGLSVGTHLLARVVPDAPEETRPGDGSSTEHLTGPGGSVLKWLGSRHTYAQIAPDEVGKTIPACASNTKHMA